MIPDHFNQIQMKVICQRNKAGIDSTFAQAKPRAIRLHAFKEKMDKLIYDTNKKFEQANLRLNFLLAFPQYRNRTP